MLQFHSLEHNAIKHGAHALQDVLGHEALHSLVDVLLCVELAYLGHQPLLWVLNLPLLFHL